MKTLETVLELQETYQQLTAAQAQIEGVPDWMRELHAEHAAKTAEIAAIEAAVEEAAHARRQAEAEAGDAEARLRRYQDQIGQVRNQREYSALLQEIDGAKAQIRDFQNQAMAALERQDAEEERLAQTRDAFADLDARYQAELAKWEEQKPEVTRQAESLRGRLEALRERLQRPILAQFDLVYRRYGGQALAAARIVARVGRGAEMWHCSACNYRVRPQAIVEIRNHGGIVQCDSCKRILYLAGAGS